MNEPKQKSETEILDELLDSFEEECEMSDLEDFEIDIPELDDFQDVVGGW